MDQELTTSVFTGRGNAGKGYGTENVFLRQQFFLTEPKKI